MKILLLGATGRTGKLLLSEALQQDYQVHCLVRDKAKVTIDHPNLQLFEGTPIQKEDLAKAMKDCKVVVNVLNVARTSDFPWAKLRTPKTFLSEVMTHIIALAEDQELKRIIVCSAWGVSETKKDIPTWFRLLIDNSNIGITYKDHERQEALLMNSNLPWTIVRPSGLTNSKKNKTILESYNNHPKPKLTISRLSLAKYMIDAINNEALLHKTPVLSNP